MNNQGKGFNMASYTNHYGVQSDYFSGGYSSAGKPCNNCGRKGQEGVYGEGYVDLGIIRGSFHREHKTDSHCTDPYGKR